MSDLTRLVRLEVERAPDVGELVNLVANPSGDLGAWGWLTPVAGSVLRSVSGALVYTSPGGAGSNFTTESLPVAAGRYVAASWVAPAVTGRYAARLQWLDAAGAVLSATTPTALVSGSADRQVYGTFLAPASTASVRLRFDHYADGSAANPAAGTTMGVREVTVTSAAASTSLRVQRINLLANPSGENSTGWAANRGALVTSSTAQSFVGSACLAFQRTDGKGDLAAASDPVPVTAGRDYALQVRFRPAGNLRKPRLFVRWLKDNGNVASPDVQLASHSESAGSWSAAKNGVATAPLNAASAQLVILWGQVAGGETHYVDAAMVEESRTVGPYFDGSTTGTGITYAWTGTANKSASTAVTGAGDVGALVPIAWQNIMGSATEISIDRGELSPGQIDVVLRDPLLDPSTSDLIRPGRRVRLTTVDGEVIAAGAIIPESISVDYELLNRDESKRAKISFTAVDALAVLGSCPRPEGVATVAELPYVLEGCGVPWSCNGSGDQVPTATVVGYNSNSTALDQVVVTRDTVLGRAWIDRNGVVQVWDRASLPGAVAATLDETVYTKDFASGFDPNTCVNSVEVVVLTIVATTGAVEEVSHGPYLDAASVAEFGVYPGTYTVQGPGWDETTIAAYAADVLSTNATPRRRVRSLAVGMTEDRLPLALLDLQDVVSVTNVRAEIAETSRVGSIQHRLEPDKWLMTVAFGEGGTAGSSVSVTAPPPAVGAVKADINDTLADVDASIVDVSAVANQAAADAAEAALTGTAAQTTADGKNSVTYSTSGPGSAANQAGDIWFVRSGSTISAQYEGQGGTSWASRVLTNVVITALDAGALTAGSAFTNALAVKTNFTLGDANTNGVIQSYDFANSPVGVFIDKNGIVAKGGQITGAVINGTEIYNPGAELKNNMIRVKNSTAIGGSIELDGAGGPYYGGTYCPEIKFIGTWTGIGNPTLPGPPYRYSAEIYMTPTGSLVIGNFDQSNADGALFVDRPARITNETWHTISPGSGMSAVSSAQTPQYRLDAAGNVHIRGGVNLNGAASGVTLATLPSNYRPAVIWQVPVSLSSGASDVGKLSVAITGVVTLSWGGTPGAMSLNTVFSIL